MKKIISEKYIRKTLRSLLLESALGVSAAKATLMANKKNFGNAMMSALKSAGDARDTTHILIRGTKKTGGKDVGDIFKHLGQFEDDFIAFLNVLDPKAGFTASSKVSLQDIFKNLISSIGGTISETSSSDRGKINAALYAATEGGTGIGTYDDDVELAFSTPELKHVLDLPLLNADYSSDARKNANFTAVLRKMGVGSGNEDMWQSLCEEGDAGIFGAGDLNAGEQVDHIIRPLIENQPFVSFENSEGETVESKLTGIVQAFFDNIPAGLLRKGGINVTKNTSSKTPKTPGTTTSTTTTTTTSGGPQATVGGSSSGGFGASQGNITIDPQVDAVIPRGGKAKFNVNDVININDFKKDLVQNIRSDARSLPTAQVYQLEISWSRKKGVNDRIHMNLTPVGVHRVVLRGKLGSKFKKAEFWDGSVKQIFADAFNNNIYPPSGGTPPKAVDKTAAPYNSAERFRIKIRFDAGYYSPTMYDKGTTVTESSKKVLIKGKDILKIVSPLKFKK